MGGCPGGSSPRIITSARLEFKKTGLSTVYLEATAVDTAESPLEDLQTDLRGGTCRPVLFGKRGTMSALIGVLTVCGNVPVKLCHRVTAQ